MTKSCVLRPDWTPLSIGLMILGFFGLLAIGPRYVGLYFVG